MTKRNIALVIVIVSLALLLLNKNQKIFKQNQPIVEKVVDINEEDAKPSYKRGACEYLLDEEEDLYKGDIAEVNFESFPKAGTFYTRITESIKTGANFAGHYFIADWGCGTDCVGYAVIDVISGEIIEYVGASGDTHLYFYTGGKYFTLDPVYAGTERNYYTTEEGDNGKAEVVVACTEIAEDGMYGIIKE